MEYEICTATCCHPGLWMCKWHHTVYILFHEGPDIMLNMMFTFHCAAYVQIYLISDSWIQNHNFILSISLCASPSTSLRSECQNVNPVIKDSSSTSKIEIQIQKFRKSINCFRNSVPALGAWEYHPTSRYVTQVFSSSTVD
jgi:hypothetical protein